MRSVIFMGMAQAATGVYPYAMNTSYMEGTDFFSMWDFWTAADPTHGHVEFVDQATAFAVGLAKKDADRVYMGVDMTSVTGAMGRKSLRIQSKAMYNKGLFIISLDHIPTGCGTWPAFWMYGEDPDHVWPTWGEYDIIEAAHKATHTMTTLHTTAGCDQASVIIGKDFSTKWEVGTTKVADNCDIRAPGQWNNQGCSQTGPQGSMGPQFNVRGGTYAAEWEPGDNTGGEGFFRAWFWPKGLEPADVLAKKPTPETWGMPYSFFRLSPTMCPASHFKNMRLVFDLTLCGELGSPTFSTYCPEFAGMTCEDFVANHPEQMHEAYWSVRSLDVYQRQPVTTTSTTTVTTPTTTVTTTTVTTTVLVFLSSMDRRPLSTADPRSLFRTARRNGSAAPGGIFNGRAAPLPTGAWWENVAVADDPASPKGNVFQMPYVVIADATKVHVMQPFPVGDTEQSFDTNLAMSLGSVEGCGGPYADSWDELSLTLVWHVDNGGSRFSVPLVRGSPYVTAEYTDATPVLSSKQVPRNGFITIDGERLSCDGAIPHEGSVFSVDFMQEDATWVMFSPKGVRWVCMSTPFSLTAQSRIRGAVRIALANNCTTGTGVHCDGAPAGRDARTYTKLLADHAGSYPVGASVDFVVSGDEGIVRWAWHVRALDGWQSGPLLQLAWPVHLPLLPPDVRSASATLPATPFHNVRGAAAAVVASHWRLHYELFPDVGLHAPRPVALNLRHELLAALRGSDGALWNGSMPDHSFDLPQNYRLGVGDTYHSGKMIARLARLIAIAGELGETDQPYFTDMVQRLTDRLQTWLAPHSKTPFVYDASWGGLVSCGCVFDDCKGKCAPRCSNRVAPAEKCPALHDAAMNFGNGAYSDHHLHYGYFVYSAAVLARHNPAWEREWRNHILAIVRDYGNPSAHDPSFPLARHKDWFLGFSWAGGITAVPAGRNQESTSEAINSYYALYAYGAMVDAPFAQELRDFGRLLTAMETHGADTYWHVRADSRIYARNVAHQVVGILWEHTAEFRTWSGAAPYIASAVHLLPITPVMEHYLGMDWVATDFSAYRTQCLSDPDCKQGWTWPMCLEQAVLDPAGAHACLKALGKDTFGTMNLAGNGNSLTNSLHWIATRPHAASIPPGVPGVPPAQPSWPGQDVELCSAHSTCMELGLTGSCCPTHDGVRLGCCQLSDDILVGYDDRGGMAAGGRHSEGGALAAGGFATVAASTMLVALVAARQRRIQRHGIAVDDIQRPLSLYASL